VYPHTTAFPRPSTTVQTCSDVSLHISSPHSLPASPTPPPHCLHMTPHDPMGPCAASTTSGCPPAYDQQTKVQKIGEKKQNMPIPELCKGFPSEWLFGRLASHLFCCAIGLYSFWWLIDHVLWARGCLTFLTSMALWCDVYAQRNSQSI